MTALNQQIFKDYFQHCNFCDLSELNSSTDVYEYMGDHNAVNCPRLRHIYNFSLCLKDFQQILNRKFWSIIGKVKSIKLLYDDNFIFFLEDKAQPCFYFNSSFTINQIYQLYSTIFNYMARNWK
jgi:hypothetical protein